ncbi:MAG: T9SS type A sorting domain-containing protein, partial [Saprospiraceae bacterium]
FQWFDCNTNLPVPGAVQSDFTPASIGFYRVRLTTIQGCEAFSDCYLVLPTATYAPLNEIQWQIFPNPAHDILYVSTESQTVKDGQLEVTDLLGHILLKQAIAKGSSNNFIELSSLPVGIFLITIQDDKGTSSTRLFTKM